MVGSGWRNSDCGDPGAALRCLSRALFLFQHVTMCVASNAHSIHKCDSFPDNFSRALGPRKKYRSVVKAKKHPPELVSLSFVRSRWPPRHTHGPGTGRWSHRHCERCGVSANQKRARGRCIECEERPRNEMQMGKAVVLHRYKERPSPGRAMFLGPAVGVKYPVSCIRPTLPATTI